MQQFISIAIALAILVMLGKLAFLFIRKSKLLARKAAKVMGKEIPANVEEKPILTDNEREFFYRLQRALPDFHVFPEVAASAILQVSPTASKRDHYSLFGRFSQKRVDYVICERDSLAVIAIIELDDRTHDAKKDQKRDALFAEAGYQVIRFDSRRKPSEKQITDYFGRLVGLPALPPLPELLIPEALEEEEPSFQPVNVEAEINTIRQRMAAQPSFEGQQQDNQVKTTSFSKDETVW